MSQVELGSLNNNVERGTDGRPHHKVPTQVHLIKNPSRASASLPVASILRREQIGSRRILLPFAATLVSPREPVCAVRSSALSPRPVPSPLPPREGHGQHCPNHLSLVCAGSALRPPLPIRSQQP